ncbi:Ceg14 family Dot/Icm T4SS effector [Legionella pneumophila]|uniref:Dot/Icm secretion system substrate n=1 Tax=Legionella pneumophila subsp. pascullei TaxID=91890 RepID=A0AAX2ITP8_LEGPN|nr:Ceg14 family Dot/Icm T4SS effector [Legionella pneumophila]AMP88454.1 type IV secretion protein Dot [Legionella pneumophila subsp. pascullei]AMP91363.1 type IV secretion protein Dot [Legionella pneumophila subsp. pascullei]AMP94352.1 type IV secretion protein Dot [Legionella pneumophila subsp. pascullei]SQG89145.1 Dot/Icm secretion system substrate [Legionella pneumophila subsp. pascullei]VEH04195.1 Dot/Icm secretion system substrate [Legionella pneumophila subsp. pascullei]
MFKKSCAKATDQNRQELFMDGLLGDFQKMKEKALNQQQERRSKKRELHCKSSEKTKKPNQYAALTHSQVQEVKAKVRTVNDKFHLNAEEKKLWELILLGNQLAQNISSCDLPTDNEDDASLVKLTQIFADETLERTDLTWLNKILKIALYSRGSGFGNCQEKAFFVFALLLHQAQKPESLIHSLRLATFNNHFILIVNEQFLMDPWLNLAFPLSKGNQQLEIGYVFEGFGRLVNYFSINQEGQCFTHAVRVGGTTERDSSSEKDMPTCIHLLLSHRDYFDLSIVSERDIDTKTKRRKYEHQDQGMSQNKQETSNQSIEPVNIDSNHTTWDNERTTDDFLEQFEQTHPIYNPGFFSFGQEDVGLKPDFQKNVFKF